MGSPQRILIIDPFLPLHDRVSGSLRLFRIIEMLASDGHDITYLAHCVREDHGRYAMDLAKLGVKVVAAPIGASMNEELLQSTLRNGQFDTAIISFFHIAQVYMPFIRHTSPRTRVIVDTVDLHFVRERRQAELAQDTSLMTRAEETYKNEIAAYGAADALIAVTDVERDVLLRELPAAIVYVVPNIHDVAGTGPGFEEREGLLFVGNFWHTPNAEGIHWFCSEVLPRIQWHFPHMKVDIIGQDPPEALRAFGGDNVHVLGWVPDVAPYLQRSRLSIAPLLHGAGLKGKVGEALSAGLPVVTTSIGAEGMGLRNGEHAMVADDAESFAEAAIAVYDSRDLWSRLAVEGREVILRNYTPAAVRLAVRKVVPAANGPVHYFGVPDWRDAVTIKRVIDAYIRRCANESGAMLELGVVDMEAQDAYSKLAQWIEELGHDVNTIPDISLTPMPRGHLGHLSPELTWVPMHSGVPAPTQLTRTESFCPIAAV